MIVVAPDIIRRMKPQGDFPMPLFIKPALSHTGPGEEKNDNEDGLALPVNPDEGIPLVPDEEGDVTVPG